MKKAVLAAALAAPLAFAEPAVVIKEDGTCFGYVPNGITESGYPELQFLVGSLHQTTNKNNTSLICKFDHTVDLPRATAGRGVVCTTYAGATTDTMMIASPGGKATLRCQLKGNP